MTKSKDGLTALEAKQRVFPRRPKELLADGSWYATGLRTPIDPNKQAEHIPAHLWEVLEINFEANTASGGGLEYVRLWVYEGEYERQLIAVPSPRTADPPAGKVDGASSGGRPTLEPEIKTAYQELLDASEINFNAPKNRIYEPIRKKVREYKGDQNLEKGLQKEAIRKVIRPLFDADKNKRSASP